MVYYCKLFPVGSQPESFGDLVVFEIGNLTDFRLQDQTLSVQQIDHKLTTALDQHKTTMHFLLIFAYKK